MSSSTVAQESVPAGPEHTQHAFAEHIHSKPMGSAEAAHLMTFLCQTEAAKKPQTLLPPQARDDNAA
ncbi:hypothetical protein MUG10_16425 [Xanthomonas prunicola]|uniref:Uncharacterized protein n=1 Tax=Xanthomonas prunicola TaxID=2053930 RepID=A0A2N3RNB2_9XANT|nr:hypothetical protein [Xanthomonas prunicola]PKV13972.1 hypothetical protein XpruCFBP8353_02370 [Xanthomonas prunicola]PKV18253.1 hypothetical protein XpruCFBP8354_02370 [Xanthomonas prunicola]PKV22436.1 hypothetical protein CVO74_04090 [Xanthomonas prunicola]USI99602.1 hypothetical protein MUG10_16425 [Xanthomonas prunicola]UXA48056.1 hypothetical protein M0D44_17370 [Xanthomonas prunicola]